MTLMENSWFVFMQHYFRGDSIKGQSDKLVSVRGFLWRSQGCLQSLVFCFYLKIKLP